MIKKWIAQITNGDSLREVAKHAKVAQATLARQVRDNALTPDTVVAVARAYQGSPVEGLIIQGLLRESDLESISIQKALESADDQQLLDEIGRRLDNGNTAWDQPLDEVIELPVSQVSDTNIDIEELRRDAAASRKNMEAEQEYWD